MRRFKLIPVVSNEKMIFEVIESVSNVSIDDLISNKSLRSLNIQRFIIRKSQKVTNKEIRGLEDRHPRRAKS